MQLLTGQSSWLDPVDKLYEEKTPLDIDLKEFSLDRTDVIGIF